MVREAWRFFALVGCLAVFHGCSMVTITSEPQGAEILYSPSGGAPWRPWPPTKAELETPPEQQAAVAKPKTTPEHEITPPEPYYYVRVQKDGYYPVAPQFVDAGLFRRQHLHFDLEPRPETLGLVWYNGRWVRPDKEGLVNYLGTWMSAREKFDREQREKGLVYDEEEKRWMTPQEKQKRVAARMQAKGLVHFKGRWLTPQEAQQEQWINDQVLRLAASGTTFALSIDRFGALFGSDLHLEAVAGLVIRDASGHPLDVLLSGPESRRLRIEGRGRKVFLLPIGTYTVAIREVDRPTAPVGIGEVDLVAKTRYLAVYRGGPGREGL